jgi:hypothetical protein
MAARNAAGVKTANAASSSTPPAALPRRSSPAQRTSAVGDGRQGDADDGAADLKGHPQIRGDEAQADDLKDEHGAAGQEDRERGDGRRQRCGGRSGVHRGEDIRPTG